MENQLSAQIIQILAPYPPYLVKGGKLIGQEALKTFGCKIGEQSLGKNQALWEKLRPQVEASPALRETVQSAAESPQEEDTLGILPLRLKNSCGKTPTCAPKPPNSSARLPPGRGASPRAACRTTPPSLATRTPCSRASTMSTSGRPVAWQLAITRPSPLHPRRNRKHEPWR